MFKKLSFLVFFLFCFLVNKAQNINFPDSLFKQFLLKYALAVNIDGQNSKIDQNNDQEISYDEALTLKSLKLNADTIFADSSSWFTDVSKLEAFKNLEILEIFGFKFETIDLGSLKKLKKCTIAKGTVQNVRIVQLLELEMCLLSNNQINNLVLLDLPKLSHLAIDQNKLSALNIAHFSALKNLSCGQNFITEICATPLQINQIEFDKDSSTTLSSICGSPNLIFFPDSNFKNELLKSHSLMNFGGNPDYVDKNNDGEISYSEADFIKEIVLNNAENDSDYTVLKIDITGISYFKNVEKIYLHFYHIINGIEINKLTKLYHLYIANGQCDSLDFSNNTSLKVIQVDDIGLKYVNLEGKKNLTAFIARENLLTKLDLSSLTSFESVAVENSPLKSMCALPWQIKSGKIQKDALCKLDTLCGQNPIPIKDKKVIAALLAHVPVIDLNGDSIITVEEALKVKTLNITYLNLPNLDGFEVFKNITTLNVSGNNLTKIDASVFAYLKKLYAAKNYIAIMTYLTTNQIIGGRTQENNENSTLEVIDLSDNNLTELDVSAITFLDSLTVSGNSNLEIVCVNSTQLSDKTSYWTKDISTNWSKQNCLRTNSTINLNNSFFSAYPNPAEDLIHVSEKAQGIFTVSGSLAQTITDNSLSININLPSGLYFIRFASGKTEKLIIK